MVKTPGFHCRRYRFDPWSGNKDPACHCSMAKEKKKKKSSFLEDNDMFSVCQGYHCQISLRTLAFNRWLYFLLILYLIILVLVLLNPCCCAWAFSSCGWGAPL